MLKGLFTKLKTAICQSKFQRGVSLTKKEKPSLIEVGETWKLPNETPWEDKSFTVKILDIKGGWVKYDMGGIFRNETKPIKDFCAIYRKCEG